MLGDPGVLAPAVVGWIVYGFLYPLPYLPQAVQRIPVAVADYDRSALSRRFSQNLDGTRELVVTSVTRQVSDAVPLLQRGDIAGIVAIPRHFDRDVARGTPTGITVMGNGAYIVADGTVLAASGDVLVATASGPLASHLAEHGAPPALIRRAASAGPVLIRQPMFNTTQGYESYVVPASMALIVHQLLLIGIAAVVGTWIEGGRWTIAPRGVLSVGAYVGMLSAFALLAWCATLFWIGFVFSYHDLPRGGNVGSAIVVGVIYALGIAALGICVGCWMADRERPFQVIGAISVPLLFLSGFAFPTWESMPPPLRWIANMLPTTHAIGAMLQLNQMGATWRETQPAILKLLAVSAFYVAVAWRLASWRAACRESTRP